MKFIGTTPEGIEVYDAVGEYDLSIPEGVMFRAILPASKGRPATAVDIPTQFGDLATNGANGLSVDALLCIAATKLGHQLAVAPDEEARRALTSLADTRGWLNLLALRTASADAGADADAGT